MNPATGYDYMRILVSTNQGGSWTEIGRLNPSQDPDSASKKTYLPYTSGGFNQPGTWVKHNFNLTSYVGGKLRIRFLFETIDQKYNGFRGWFIDDVEVAPAQIGLSQFSPASIELRPPLPPVSR